MIEAILWFFGGITAATLAAAYLLILSRLLEKWGL